MSSCAPEAELASRHAMQHMSETTQITATLPPFQLKYQLMQLP